jgi:hypothetical protein
MFYIQRVTACVLSPDAMSDQLLPHFKSNSKGAE